MIAESVITQELVRFLVPAMLGGLAYMLATMFAHFISSVPRYVYVGRLVFVAVFVFLIWFLYAPFASVGFSGSAAHYYEIGGDARGMGAFYGMQTTWIWCILAVLKWPNAHHDHPA